MGFDMTGETDPRFATTLARGLSVLRSIRSIDDGLSNAELAARTGLPKSTVSRLTWTLCQLGYLTQSVRDERFRPGPTLVAVGHVAAGSMAFMSPAEELMADLANQTGTLAVLAVRDIDRLIVVRTWRPLHLHSMWMEVGHRLPPSRRSSSRAFAAALTDAEYAQVQAQIDSIGSTGFPHDERLAAQQELQQQGYVTNFTTGERTTTYLSVSVPFRPAELNEPVVFTCGALPADASVGHILDTVGPRLRAAVNSLERLTGHAPSQADMEVWT